MSTRTLLAIALLMAPMGCSDDGVEGLEVSYQPDSTTGTFVASTGTTVSFQAEQTAPETVSVVIEVNGMTLRADVGKDADGIRTADLNAFATANGEETVMSAGERDSIKELALALAADKAEREYYSATMLRNVAVVWAKTPLTAPLARTINQDAERTVSFLCTRVNGYQTVTGGHDCHVGCPWYNPLCWKMHYNTVDIGPGGYYSEIGECSFPGMANDSYTQDCLNHDLCVGGPHNHWDVSGYCMNEATAAGDDQLWNDSCASCGGHCGGSSSSDAGGCYCDAACATYGDCCFDKNAACGG